VKQGCDLPDGFYFANWSQFPDCSVPVDAMHNGVFPGYLVQFALTSEAAKCVARRPPKKEEFESHQRSNAHRTHTAHTRTHTRFKRDGFDPLSMALAFGSHVYADVVGFHTPYGGYCNPPLFPPPWPRRTARLYDQI
jgi:hypothetical protein